MAAGDLPTQPSQKTSSQQQHLCFRSSHLKQRTSSQAPHRVVSSQGRGLPLGMLDMGALHRSSPQPPHLNCPRFSVTCVQLRHTATSTLSATPRASKIIMCNGASVHPDNVSLSGCGGSCSTMLPEIMGQLSSLSSRSRGCSASKLPNP